MHPVSAPEQYQPESWRPENWFCCLSLIQSGIWKKVRIILYKINKTENLVSSSFCLLEATLNINGEAAVSWFIDIHDIYFKVIVLDWHMYRTGYQNSEYFFLNPHAVCAPFPSRYLKRHIYTLSSTLTIKLPRHFSKLHIYSTILCRHVHDRGLGPLHRVYTQLRI